MVHPQDHDPIVFDNAGGLREGAPVRLAGVDIGNVTRVQVVQGQPATPVEVTMKVNTKFSFNLRKDSVTVLSTAGILGETYVDIDSAAAKDRKPPMATRYRLAASPIFRMWFAPARALCKTWTLCSSARPHPRFVESGQGSIGKVIYSPALYDQLNATVAEFKGLVDDVQSGKGSLGPLFTSDEAYKKVMTAIDKINVMVDDLQAGKGTAGKLLKDLCSSITPTRRSRTFAS